MGLKWGYLSLLLAPLLALACADGSAGGLVPAEARAAVDTGQTAPVFAGTDATSTADTEGGFAADNAPLLPDLAGGGLPDAGGGARRPDGQVGGSGDVAVAADVPRPSGDVPFADNGHALPDPGPDPGSAVADPGQPSSDDGPVSLPDDAAVAGDRDVAHRQDSGPGAECSYHSDCNPDRVCAHWRSLGKRVCSEPCAGPGDCRGAQVCRKLPGSANVAYCVEPALGERTVGGLCSDDDDCANGQCVDGECVALCLGEAQCPEAERTCEIVGSLAEGTISGACTQPLEGSLPNGAQCTLDGYTHDGSVCASGHCDLLLTLGLGPAFCAPLCSSERDCASSQECGVVLYAARQNQGSTPLNAEWAPGTRDAIMGCFTEADGTHHLPTGSACTHPRQCAANKCLNLIPGDPNDYCTGYCAGDEHCPAGMRCKLSAVTLAGRWLLAAGEAATTEWTYVRICMFE